ncbi:MAG: branched-chain amino acid ABC transporter substrate-binding protein [Elusimicrobia bacterium]|nr:branched-chain amino acid ABC transporter substrate-binding protein [Elusimicrobiota bacterium]
MKKPVFSTSARSRRPPTPFRRAAATLGLRPRPRLRLSPSAWPAVLLSAAFLAAGCGKRDRPVRIAVAAPLTGDMGTEGQGLSRAVELAVEEANAAKALPFRVEVAPFDDRADPQEAVNVANLIALDPRIAAVVGHYNSGCCIAAARVYAQAGMAMVTPSATNPEVTLQQTREGWPGPRTVFRLVPTDDVQGAYAASFMVQRLRKRTVALVHDGTAYGRDLTAEFKKVFTRLGGKVLLEDCLDPRAKEARKLIARVKSADPQAVYFAGVYTEAGVFVKGMRTAGLKAVFVSGDGAKTPGFFDVAGEASDGAYVSMVGVPVEVLPSAKDFVERYRERWKKSGEGLKPYDHLAYEAARIVLAAMERAGRDRAGIVSAIRRRPHAGFMGTVVFDAKGDVRTKVVTMTQARYKDRGFAVIPFVP